MRPARLTMQAFGPYCEIETVDFGELGPNRVFLIHGDTGAGKTTILDAMVFALYGDTSGGERQGAQMRCESAPDTLPTEVTFEFTIGAKCFRVRRRPQQELEGARGAKVTKQAEATLWDCTGCGDGQEGRLLTTKISEANARIKEELGFSSDQFRQVVVLPQGRFRELLSAGSNDREDILRQLFRTARFRELELALGERARAIRAQMQETNAQRSAQLGLADAADDSELAALGQVAEVETQAAVARVAEAAAVSATADEALSAAEGASEARASLAAAAAQLERLEARQDEIAALRAHIDGASRAARVQPSAGRLGDAQVSLAAASEGRRRADDALATAREQEQAAVERLAGENARQPEREAASEEVRRLEGFVRAIGAWSAASAEAAAAQTKAESARNVAEAAYAAEAEGEQLVRSLREHLETARAAAARTEDARTRYEAARQHEDRCRRLLMAREAMEAAEERLWCLAAAERDTDEALVAAELALARWEDRWRAGRAGALAAGLAPGAPCPVCGAVDHPAPAGAHDSDVTDDQLAAAKTAVDLARRSHSLARDAESQGKNDAAVAQATERAIQQEPGARSGLSLADATDEAATCRAELESLSVHAQAADLEAALTAAESALTQARTQTKQTAGASAAQDKAAGAAEARLAERAASVPEELRATGALDTALARAGGVKVALEAGFAAAQQGMSDAKENRIGLESAAQAALAAAVGAEEHERACSADFQKALIENAFPGEAGWRAALLSDTESAALVSGLESYSDALNQAKGRLHQAQSAVVGLAEPGDVAAIRAKADEARAVHRAAMSHEADARNTLAKLEKITRVLADIDARAEHIRRQHQTVGVLADVATGSNVGRVSFQRWVLGVYLDEVLVGASRRLFAMSKGRYRLERQKEAASRGRASGLDLAVFDEFSGSSRPAVTLSGGESFLAALALALGLADTVQEHAPGAPLETILVDEGFGALDSDALELAIDALMELQLGGRLVGVISHVPELRQVIPARLEVRGGSGGSSTRFVVP